MAEQKYSDFVDLREMIYRLFDIFKSESRFILLVGVLTIAAAFITPYPQIAMWFGFILAGYSAVANDSIQTIGTFIVSNQHRKWYVLWLYIGLIFVATVTYSFIVFNGDVSYQRLQTPGLDQAPQTFTFLQLIAPLILIILTRLRMPVSTTFLLLTIFSTKSSAVLSVLTKSVSGYLVSFITAIIVWFVIRKLVKYKFKGKAHPAWMVVQWITSGTLWSVWVMQDAANIAVFLPRALSLGSFLAFTLFIFFGLGLLFYLKGDRIQKIVNEKSGIADIRSATLVDFVYALILIYFKQISQIPMSTTWVFLGLLAGRELAISITKKRKKRRKMKVRETAKMIGKDVLMAAIGLAVSLLLAISINERMREEFWALF
tara:strand:- start:1063 stop:2181 length:1119 start_codon:yes stop_codon:yes gene_type:complete